MKRALLILTLLPFVAAVASAQTPSTAPVQASTAPAVSTGPATAPMTQVQPSTAPATAPGGGAWRPGRGPWHRDCDADVQRLCPGLTTRDQVEDCLKRNEAQLSPACQNIRKKEGRRR